MIGFDIINSLKTYCETKDILFVTGNQFIQNIDIEQPINMFQYILVCDLSVTPVLGKAKQIINYNYEGLIMLGRKSEFLTESSIAENLQDKWDNRLLELHEYIVTIIIGYCCENDLELELGKSKLDLNRFDTSIDFVAYTNIVIKE